MLLKSHYVLSLLQDQKKKNRTKIGWSFYVCIVQMWTNVQIQEYTVNTQHNKLVAELTTGGNLEDEFKTK